MKVVAVIVLFYCGWQSQDLLDAWFNTPHLKWGWIAFILWFSPVLLYFDITFGFLFAAVAATLLGTLGSLNALQHVGLAFACLGCLPSNWGNLVWFVAAICWMPSFGYIVKGFSIGQTVTVRLVLASIGCLWELIILRKKTS